jgi:hypothetical protein
MLSEVTGVSIAGVKGLICNSYVNVLSVLLTKMLIHTNSPAIQDAFVYLSNAYKRVAKYTLCDVLYVPRSHCVYGRFRRLLVLCSAFNVLIYLTLPV